mmetsp:Transcript_105402/g.314818  ORF Transcript_105402/g.314818 Transcript_105402/m.314818 type:complete len:318 (-) Transcript_105402:2413-3366(-)
MVMFRFSSVGAAKAPGRDGVSIRESAGLVDVSGLKLSLAASSASGGAVGGGETAGERDGRTAMSFPVLLNPLDTDASVDKGLFDLSFTFQVRGLSDLRWMVSSSPRRSGLRVLGLCICIGVLGFMLSVSSRSIAGGQVLPGAKEFALTGELLCMGFRANGPGRGGVIILVRLSVPESGDKSSQASDNVAPKSVPPKPNRGDGSATLPCCATSGTSSRAVASASSASVGASAEASNRTAIASAALSWDLGLRTFPPACSDSSSRAGASSRAVASASSASVGASAEASNRTAIASAALSWDLGLRTLPPARSDSFEAPN